MKKKEKDELIEKEAENASKEVIKRPRKKTTKSIRKKTKKVTEMVEEDTITKNYDFNLLEVVIIILITGIVVSIASGLIVYNNYDNLFINKNNGSDTIDQDALSVFEENYNRILNEYVEEVDKQELLDAALSGMYNYLGDSYTTYMDQDTTQSLEEQLEGQYTGIGIEIVTYYDGTSYETFINKVFEDSPASEAGLLSGDKLLELNGVLLNDKDGNYVSNTIKNSSEPTHTLKILRNSEEIELTLTRKQVYINSVTSEIHDGVGYIKIDTFSRTTMAQVKKYLDEFDESVKSLVIDVRDNTGGLLTTAYEVSDLFIEKGKNIYQIKDREGNVTSYQALEDVYRKFDNVAVIINENSASASEIFALALKESADAKIVGVKSFGKGSVQETKKLSTGAMVKITTAYWLSPNGNSINEVGITPDILVEDINLQISEAVKAVK